ncbi:hypothetical protein AVEN_159200-1 [Araneus ventricosus]|uniref:Uncharacterized protein n=1 Tax=Araneus ventricosus TaxID=182803 RepID=A0A4Y2RK35_ARAVE|nr:hypothetical protein AVEN_159200-1 [Araneus ventricosus]
MKKKRRNNETAAKNRPKIGACARARRITCVTGTAAADGVGERQWQSTIADRHFFASGTYAVRSTTLLVIPLKECGRLMDRHESVCVQVALQE